MTLQVGLDPLLSIVELKIICNFCKRPVVIDCSADLPYTAKCECGALYECGFRNEHGLYIMVDLLPEHQQTRS
jgi:hypothetical protein